MTPHKDLAKLRALTELVLDDRLQRLRNASAARDRSLMQMSALTAAAAPADLPLVAAERVGLAYQRWADLRRAELNIVIARQTAEVMAAQAEASRAFGRAEAIKGVAAKLGRR